jgi:hypothetical protein
MTGEPPADRPGDRDPVPGWETGEGGLPWWAGDVPIDVPLEVPIDLPPHRPQHGDAPPTEPRPAEPRPAASGPTDAELAEVVAFPATSEIYPDARGGDRWMRVTWHPEADCVVLSVWRSTTCIATMRVARGDVPGLVASLVGGLVDPATTHQPSTPPTAARTDTG